MHKQEPIIENEMDKNLRDFEIHTYFLIPARRSDKMIVNKKKSLLDRGTDRPYGSQSENLKKRIEMRVLKPTQRSKKKLWNMKVTVILLEIGELGTFTKGLEMGWKSRNSKDISKASKEQHF